MKKLQACRKCGRLTTEKMCSYCKSTDLTTSWKGLLIVLDVESEIAKMLGIKEKGKYALYVG
ncbi:MAG: DNA-directed RNA polymerase, subunit E'' [Candidatus Aenigmarchaeota archaeon]|jgi:RNA polymerase subunit RPABC4/transcription elongation factor Spt4|nr:DNA-directed RNA polymerase, subunit E'' [Candidatus Aenigmarchaeota archaeon]